ncbi:hypothetical protein BX616_000570 [Lobosporangium transversale]|nr:hypothetical protein BX616_000570 [Lobosporangium transversale]
MFIAGVSTSIGADSDVNLIKAKASVFNLNLGLGIDIDVGIKDEFLDLMRYSDRVQGVNLDVDSNFGFDLGYLF